MQDTLPFSKKEIIMLTPKWFNKELELIDPMFFCIFNPSIERWQIRKWKGVYPKALHLWDTDASELIFTVTIEDYTEDDGFIADAGYKDLDMSEIHAIRKSHWFKLKWKKRIAEIDWKNEMLERRANQRLEDESKMAAKAIWRHYREPTVDYGGRNKY